MATVKIGYNSVTFPGLANEWC